MGRVALSIKRKIAAKLFPFSSTIDRACSISRWCSTIKHVECPTFADREKMYSYLQGTLIKGDPIDYLEFGVAGGASMQSWCKENGHSQSRFFGFDSFRGLPENWTMTKPKGTFDCGGHAPEIHDSRVQFITGSFQSTLPAFLESFVRKNRIVVHNDSDLYSSTLYVLTMLHRTMPADAIIIFDEFYDAQHEFRALTDYCAAYRRQFRVIAAAKNFMQAAVFLENAP